MVSVAIVVCLVLLAFQPLLNDLNEKGVSSKQIPHEIPAAFRDLSRFVGDLMNNTDDTNHSDSDGLPDSVELVIGTDPFNPDSDFDTLSDYDEAFMGMDPLKADSNDDRFSDYLEVTGHPLDLDGDGLPNAWDPDNDDDGVPDYLDTSPFAKTLIDSGFQIDILTSGEPTYVSFQLRTNDPDHMRLIQQTWDWPDDSKGSFRDLDGSVDDVVIVPMLRLNCTNLPDQGDVEDYGIITDGSSAYVPLFPVWEYGNMVALKGRMFFPQTTSELSASLDLSLMWRVSGLNDNEIRAFAAESGDYLSVQSDGSIIANGDDTGANETFVWISLGSDRGALMATNGLYMALDPDGSISASSDGVTPEAEFVFDREDDGTVVIVASNGFNLTAAADGTLSAADDAEGGIVFTEVDLGIMSSPMVLATYYEDFMLTGLEVTENFGSSIGVFNGTDLNELIAANLLLAYRYLRNSSTSLSDVPTLLSDYNFSAIASDIRDFPHQDKALQEAMSTMIPSAVDSIAHNETMPVIVGVEDAAASVELGQLSGEYIVDGPIAFDLSDEPLVVSKVLRSSWYTGGDDIPLELYQVIDEIRGWDLNDSALTSMVSFVSAWYCGEFAIASVGGVSVEHDYPEVVILDETVETIITSTLMAIDMFLTAFEILDTAYAFCETFVRLGTIVKTAGQSTWDLFKTTFNSIKQTLTSSTTLMERISTAMNVIGVIIAVGISLYALFAIGEELGWGAVGTGIAVTYSVVMLAYSLALIALAAFGGPVGIIIALVIAIVDTILQIFGIDFIGLFIEWLIDCFTDTRTRSNVDLEYVDSDMSFVDVDGNGIDVGDNISYSSRLYGNVTITGDGSYSDLVDSYIIPHQVISTPWGSRSTGGSRTVANSTVYTSTSKSVLYETEAWVRPGIGMVNFPAAIGLYSDYRIYYDDCWWFFGWWCDRESQTNDAANTQVSHWTTIYFDVMPGSIDEFGDWRGMVSSDSDGDGLNKSEEVAEGTDPWKWDTDGDGLGDAYEAMIGSDPSRYSGRDTDGDGLDDRFEHTRGYNFTNEDSDGDGLTDFFEYRGWAVNLTYRNNTYYWLVNSDPHLNDTDGDGINDFEEYYCLLNPRSVDTDGDGTQDEITDYYLTRIDFSSAFVAEGVGYAPFCVSLDEDGLVYTDNGNSIVIFDQNGTEIGGFPTPAGISNIDLMSANVSGERQSLLFVNTGSSLLVYATNGTLMGEVPGSVLVGIDVGMNGMTLDPDGPDPGTYYLYILDSYDFVHKFVMNGTEMVLEEISWGGYGTGPGEFDLGWAPDMDLDEDGYVYISDAGNDRIQKFESDGTFVTMWGETGTQDGFLSRVRGMVVDANGDILTLDSGGDFADRIQKWTTNGRWMCSVEEDYIAANGIAVDGENRIYLASWQNVTVCSHYMELIQAEPDYVFLDADSDGLTDVQEDSGWSITVATEESTSSFTVSSEPTAPDTDTDGIPDPDEFALLSNPRSIDSDEDGLQDLEEWELGTNLTHWDTDGDGLGDGAEVEFGSDPKLQDTDGEGLSDYEEFVMDLNPNAPDTDQDDLDDFSEIGFGSDPKNPDTDGDFMFDGQEYELGTNPNSGDSDSDGVDDGYEVLYDTDATSGDSDGDGLSDGFEISSLMSPLSNDTDGDGVDDSRELELGLNPKSTDSDGDGIPDSLDLDYLLELEGDIVLAYDDLGDCAGFVFNLSEHATVRVIDVDTLQSDHAGERYIVLVGSPDPEAGGVGGLISDLLADSGDVLDRMRTSEYERMAVRYGLWNETQTVVMLSHVYDSDWIRVLGILKSMRMTVSDRGVLVDYLNPRSCFLLDQADILRTTDTTIWTKLSNMTTFSVEVQKLHDDEVDKSLSGSDALSSDEVIMDKYIRIEFESHDPNMSDIVSGSLIKMYYTAADLDMNGDGDADDAEDLNESSLRLYLLSSDGSWVRLSDIVDTTGVNTTDVELFGIMYEGYLWANVSGLSLFGIAGLQDEPASQGIPWLLLLVAVTAAVLLIAAAIAVRRRRHGGNEPEPPAPAVSE
ncbi:MAG TPA: hypothetical protein VMW71_03135 [Thermoplasmata archaeon]|nr:hypothetical protein [Thermoplasmata archaeon]